MHGFPRIALQRLLLCLLAVSLLTGPGGATWCVDAEGHSHVKRQTALNEACCGTSPDAAESVCGQCELNPAEEHCDRHLHIALSAQLAPAKVRKDHLPVDAGLTLARMTSPALPLFTCTSTTDGLFPDPPPRVAEPLLHHRTIVLLI